MHQRGLALRPVDIDRSAAVRVMSGNGHKPRTVGLDSGATATIQRWANRRRETSLGLSPGLAKCDLFKRKSAFELGGLGLLKVLSVLS